MKRSLLRIGRYGCLLTALFSFGLGGCQAITSGDGRAAQTVQSNELTGEATADPLELEVADAEELVSVWEPPLVEGDRLWTHVESLVGQRYWATERSATRQQVTESLVALGWEVQEQAFDQGINLVATYPLEPGGIETPQQQILVGAHYDTVQGSPGADDNATGVATLLELAALYDEQARAGNWAKAESRPDQSQRDLMLVFFDQEEQGLLGSLAFTAEPGNLETIHSAVVLDMLGATCGEPGCQQYPEFLDQLVKGQRLSDVGDFIAVVGEAERPGLLGAFGNHGSAGDASLGALPDVLLVPVPFKGLLTPDVLRSDHAPFWLNGVGAVLVTDTANLRNPHYHQPTDDLSQVDRAFFEGVTQRVVNGVWRLLAGT